MSIKITIPEMPTNITAESIWMFAPNLSGILGNPTVEENYILSSKDRESVWIPTLFDCTANSIDISENQGDTICLESINTKSSKYSLVSWVNAANTNSGGRSWLDLVKAKDENSLGISTLDLAIVPTYIALPPSIPYVPDQVGKDGKDGEDLTATGGDKIKGQKICAITDLKDAIMSTDGSIQITAVYYVPDANGNYSWQPISNSAYFTPMRQANNSNSSNYRTYKLNYDHDGCIKSGVDLSALPLADGSVTINDCNATTSDYPGHLNHKLISMVSDTTAIPVYFKRETVATPCQPNIPGVFNRMQAGVQKQEIANCISTVISDAFSGILGTTETKDQNGYKFEVNVKSPSQSGMSFDLDPQEDHVVIYSAQDKQVVWAKLDQVSGGTVVLKNCSDTDIPEALNHKLITEEEGGNGCIPITMEVQEGSVSCGEGKGKANKLKLWVDTKHLPQVLVTEKLRTLLATETQDDGTHLIDLADNLKNVSVTGEFDKDVFLSYDIQAEEWSFKNALQTGGMVRVSKDDGESDYLSNKLPSNTEPQEGQIGIQWTIKEGTLSAGGNSTNTKYQQMFGYIEQSQLLAKIVLSNSITPVFHVDEDTNVITLNPSIKDSGFIKVNKDPLKLSIETSPPGQLSIDEDTLSQVLQITSDSVLKNSADTKKNGYIRVKEGKWSVEDSSTAITGLDQSLEKVLKIKDNKLTTSSSNGEGFIKQDINGYWQVVSDSSIIGISKKLGQVLKLNSNSQLDSVNTDSGFVHQSNGTWGLMPAIVGVGDGLTEVLGIGSTFGALVTTTKDTGYVYQNSSGVWSIATLPANYGAIEAGAGITFTSNSTTKKTTISANYSNLSIQATENSNQDANTIQATISDSKINITYNISGGGSGDSVTLGNGFVYDTNTKKWHVSTTYIEKIISSWMDTWLKNNTTNCDA